ncbi:Protein N-terminal amidase [Termitomyces sp. T112]|nr:Protein N-terminal amidase [Termitomyces sp. T112]
MIAPIPSIATQTPRHIPLRIAVVQLRPKIGEVNANITRAREFCFKLTPHSIDLLCFPEMAFTGEVTSLIQQKPSFRILRSQKQAPAHYSAKKSRNIWAATSPAAIPSVSPKRSDVLSRKPILLTNNDASSGIVSLASAFAHRKVHTPVGANSAILYGPSGEWVGGYRKTNLFETDKTWAKAGTGFVSFSLTLPHVTSTESENAPAPNPLEMSIAICMDLNPAPSHEQTPSVEWSYELADYCVRNKSRLLVLLDAWLDSDSDDGEDEEDAGDGASDSANNNNHNNNHSYREKDGEVEGIVDAEADEPNWHTLRYWAARLQPLWGRDWRRPGSNETLLSDESGGNYDKAEGEEEAFEEAIDNQEEDRPPHETIVVVCNRTGTENGITFAGSSAIFSMRAGSGRPKLLDMMGKNEEGIRVWNLLV